MKRVGGIVRKLKSYSVIPRSSVLASAGFALMKFVLAILEQSYFIAVHGLYAAAVAAAKWLSLKSARVSEGNREKELKYYFHIALVLTAATVFYLVYSVRHFFIVETFGYGSIVGIGVAAVSFAELFVAAVGLRRSKKKDDLLRSGLKCVNLSSAFTAIAFTQTAILSFTSPERNYSAANALGGITFGSLSLVLCFLMLMQCLRKKKKLLKEAPSNASKRDCPNASEISDAECDTDEVLSEIADGNAPINLDRNAPLV